MVMNNMPDIFSRYSPYIEEQLRTLFTGRDLPMYGMMKYHMGWVDEKGKKSKDASNGKMLRGTLCLLAAESVTGDFRTALPASAAIELIHNYSLVHDDIQDGDELRRHRPTVWKIWGSPQAINAGSALKILAVLSVLRLNATGIPPSKQLDVCEILETSCLRMIEGQYMDIDFEGREHITVEQYLEMIERKTSALIAAALESGAVLGMDRESLGRFTRFGKYLGVAFQITDDILGIWGDDGKTGKSRGNDIRKKKKSLPVVFCMQEGEKRDALKLSEIYAGEKIGDNGVDTVLKILEACNVREFCQKRAEKYYHLALDELKGLPVKREYLKYYREIAGFLINRDF